MIESRQFKRGLATALEAEAQLIPPSYPGALVEAFALEAFTHAAPLIRGAIVLVLFIVGTAPRYARGPLWKLLVKIPGGRQTKQAIRGVVLLRVAQHFSVSS